jgi:uncharacterized protein (UPF0303 family)
MSEVSKISSIDLIEQEASLVMSSFSVVEALEIGEIAKILGINRKLPIAIEVRIGEWVIFHASLPGSVPQNQSWLDRKARVVLLKHHSTLYERLDAEERRVDWYQENKLTEELYAIHGGGIPIFTKNNGLVGVLLISGLLQLDDHNFGIEVLSQYLERRVK